LKAGSKGKCGDKEEHEKELKKERPTLRNTSSQSLFKVEAKVDIKPYQGEIYVIELNQWFQ
jgi:hypothetical protein